MQLLTEDQRREVQSNADIPARFLDPDTHIEYVMLPLETYERMKSLIVDEPLSEADERRLLSEVGSLVGWDDPIMDVYNDLDPRKFP